MGSIVCCSTVDEKTGVTDAPSEARVLDGPCEAPPPLAPARSFHSVATAATLPLGATILSYPHRR